MSEAGCIFCEILAGRSPGSFVYRDDQVAAFMTLGAVNPGHAMVVPVRHASMLEDLDLEVGGQMFKVGMRIAAALRRSDLRCEGVNMLLNDGRAAFQSIFHTHLHVFPRWRHDGFGLIMPPGFTHLRPRHELEAAAASLRAALAAEEKTPAD